MADHDATESATSTDVEKKISGKALKKLLKDLRENQDEIDEISGQMGSAVEKATKKFNFNRKAFRMIRQLDKMTAEKLADFVDDFMYMLDVSGLSDRAKSAQRLPLEEDNGADNVTHLRAAE